MIQFLKTIMVWLVAIVFVSFILFQFFTNPVGSAHFVTDVAGAIGSGFSAVMDFIQALGE